MKSDRRPIDYEYLLFSVSRRLDRGLVRAMAVAWTLLTLTIFPGIAHAEASPVFHPVFIVITQRVADEKPQEAFVEPWLLTDGKRFVFLNDYCKGARIEEVPHKDVEQPTSHDRWSDVVCPGGRRAVLADSSQGQSALVGLNNRGESIRISNIRVAAQGANRIVGNVIIAPGKQESSKAWSSAFEGLPGGLMGFYVVSTDQELLRRLVPFGRGSPQQARALYEASLGQIERGTLQSQEFCFQSSAAQRDVLKCIDGWYPARPEPIVKPPKEAAKTFVLGVRNAYFHNSGRDRSLRLMLGVERRLVAAYATDPAIKALTYDPIEAMGMVLLSEGGLFWMRNTFVGNPPSNGNVVDYSRIMYVPRATLTLGKCQYVATALDSVHETFVLLSVPGPTKACPNRATHLIDVESED